MTTLDEDAKHKAVGNERTKLTATFLNGLAVGIFIVGAVGPVLAYVLSSQAPAPALALVVAAGLACMTAAGALHLFARALLGGIRP